MCNNGLSESRLEQYLVALKVGVTIVRADPAKTMLFDGLLKQSNASLDS